MDARGTPIQGLVVLTPKVYSDARGSFCELLRNDKIDSLLGNEIRFMQDNVSWSRMGTLRGLHLQLKPREQGKLVFVAQGRIYDVAVDLRPESPTFAQYFSIELSSDDPKLFWIPPGFAHGFLVLSANATVYYKTTDVYSPELEKTIRWDDPELAIQWPLNSGKPLVSEKDQAAPFLTNSEIRKDYFS